MIARIVALLACRAHKQVNVLPVLYDGGRTFLCIKLIMHMFYFLSGISCGRRPLQKVLLNAKRACDAVMKENAHFSSPISHFHHFIPISHFHFFVPGFTSSRE